MAEGDVDKKKEQSSENGPTANQAQAKEESEALKPSEMESVELEEAEIKPVLSPEEIKREKFKIMKNMLIVSFGFLFLFTAFQSLQNLQSSLNPDKGLGLASLSVIYAALILSCMFVPPLMVGRLGCKWTLVISMIGYVLYTASNYYARWWTLIPASIIIGTYKPYLLSILFYLIKYITLRQWKLPGNSIPHNNTHNMNLLVLTKLAHPRG